MLTRSWKTLSFVFLSFVVASCAQKGRMKGDCGCKKNQAQQLSTGTDYYEYHKIYFSQAPTQADLEAFKEMGIKVVIDLREESEIQSEKFNEAQSAKELGLEYFNVSVPKKEPLSTEKLQAVEKTVMAHHKEHQILIHCSTGQRAAAWFAYHQVEHHQVEPRKAMKMAKKVGLKDKKMKKKLKEYLKLSTQPKNNQT